MTTPTDSGKDYPSWICSFCGETHGKTTKDQVATFHIGICGWCGNERAVTEPRDYGYPKFVRRNKQI